MCQRLNTGESNNFYFGIFICIGPLSSDKGIFDLGLCSTTQYFSTDPSRVLHRPRSNSVLQYRPIPSTTQTQIKLSTSVQTYPQYYTDPDQTQYFSTDPPPSTTQTQIKLSTSVQTPHPVLHRPRSNSVLQYRPIPSTTQT